MENSHGLWILVDTFFSKWANSSGHFQRVNSRGLIEVLHTCNELVSKNESSIRNVWSKLLQIITAATFGLIPTTESKGLIQLSKICPNVSTTPIMAMGCQQCLPLSVVHLKGKHCRKPHCRNGVVDTFGHCGLHLFKPHCYFRIF